MLSKELKVKKNSDYYLHTPTAQAMKAFFHPICVGYFSYDAGYQLERSSYDSFLLMLIKKGTCFVTSNGETHTAKEGQIVILDCYSPHSYYSDRGWDALWIHIDGPVSREYYEIITANNTNIFSLKDSYKFEKYLNRIYLLFKEGSSIKEALLSQYITFLLTELLISNEISPRQSQQADIIEESIVYINEHLAEELTLDDLASKASLSLYYFMRLFKRETGFTPHEYLLKARINTAKFLLKNTQTSIKEICFCTGFSNESSFCTAFKKRTGLTPTAYRSQE